jgi:hypothetical protein
MNENDKDAVEKLKVSIEKRWDEVRDLAVTERGPTDEDCDGMFEKMITDRAQLLRILVARKYEMENSINLFFDQLRFRARWKPQSITIANIPNALPCKFGL